MNRTNAYDDVVLGSGMAGMTAALLLARQGRRVALVERNAKLAPLLRGHARDGLTITAGFHLSGGLDPDGALSVLLGYLGVMDGLEPIAMDEEACNIVHLGDSEPIGIPLGRERLEEALRARFPASNGAITAYLDQLWDYRSTLPFINYDCEFRDHPRGAAPSLNLDDYLQQRGCEPGPRRLIDRLGWMYSGARAHEIALNHHNLVMGSLYHSAHMLRGGGGALVKAFERQLARSGVEVFCGRAARQTLRDDRRRVVGVELEDGERLDCSQCICTIHPQRIERLFDRQEDRPGILRQLAGRENSFALFGIFLKLPAPPRMLRRSVYFRVFDEAGEDGSAQPPSLFIACGAPDAESGCCVLTLLSPCRPPAAPPRADDRARQELLGAFKDRMVESMMSGLAQVFPELARAGPPVAVMTPGAYEAWTDTVDGAAYGLKHTTRHRPLQPYTDVGGFYLAGHSILTNGLVGAALSGLLAAGCILGLENLWIRLKQWRDAK